MNKAAIISGYGVNSEMETQEALKRAGMPSDIIHVNDFIDKRSSLANYRLIVFPGGFSYGDDTGAGNAFANRMRNNLWPELEKFLEGDNLVLGICNGFQILVNLGLLPAFNKKPSRQVALLANSSGSFQSRFVTIKPASESYWTKGIQTLYCPVSHGEGNFYCNRQTLDEIEAKKLVCFRYVKPDSTPANGEFPFNPNGALNDIAGITSEDGKVLGLMPHAERALDFTNLYNWPLEKEKLKRAGKEIPKDSMNLQFFRNIAERLNK